MQYATAVKVSAIINLALEEGKNPLEITFGQYEKYAVSAVDYLESRRKYLGQMDLNINSPKVWRFFAETIKKLAGYGASIVRLDAFAYMSKKAGAKNFLNEPETFELLSQIKKIADEYNLSLLPEIHAGYADKTYQKLAQDGYMIYDFFLPGLVLDALERKNADRLAAWADELREQKIRAVNMLGCHDGIPLLDLKGLIPDEEIESLIQTIIGRGGFIKNLHGNKNLYYQVSSTYYSALGEDNKKMLLARAIQLFMPGKPQVWYLDLFLGKNNHDAVRRAGESGHREINRTSLSAAEVEEGLKLDAVRKQLEMLRFRNTFPAFGFESEFKIKIPATHEIEVCWRRHGYLAVLRADLSDCSFVIEGTTDSGKAAFSMSL
jgi:sucrose phosphorylase